MMSITHFCFFVGSLAALVGMMLGMVMGISQDFSLTPVHAHLNLLGWVTMALYGLYHRSSVASPGRFEWMQVVAAAVGFPMMTGGLAVLLTGASSPLGKMAEPTIILGSLLSVGAMALFSAIVLRDALRSRKRHPVVSAVFDLDTNSG